jgi:hypothetical protein
MLPKRDAGITAFPASRTSAPSNFNLIPISISVACSSTPSSPAHILILARIGLVGLEGMTPWAIDHASDRTLRVHCIFITPLLFQKYAAKSDIVIINNK